ncbi:MAG: leucine-rich repeat protein [Clostridia bacterium]|nr:leucine-rich repeat protein [Clostridia bacterium]
MKRFLSLVLCLTLLLSAVPMTVSAKTYNDGAFEYEKINSSSAAKIVKYNGLDDTLIIPETLGGLPVVAIADGAVECTNGVQVESVSIPKYLSSFSADVFYGNHSLKTIELDEENTSFCLVDGVLYDSSMGRLVLYPAMSEAKEFTVPEGVKVIGSAAFYHAQNLEYVCFPDTLTTIAPAKTNLFGAFEDCVKLSLLNIPTSVKTIGDYAFMGCISLEQVNIPRSSLKERTIGLGAFLNCPKLESVRLFDCVKTVEAEAFGYVSALNGEGMMTSTQVESFTIYGISENEGGGKYAVDNDLDFVKMSVKSDFFFSDISLIGPEEELSVVSGVSAMLGKVPETMNSLFLDLPMAYMTFDLIAASGKEIPTSFADEVFYSVPVPSVLDTNSGVYVFAVDLSALERGECPVTFVPSYLGNSVDTWGYEMQRLMFSAKENQSFLFVSGVPTPGLIAIEEVPSAEPTVSDLTALAKFLGGSPIALNYLNCDLNGDGKVDVADLTGLAKLLADWDGPLYSFGVKC